MTKQAKGAEKKPHGRPTKYTPAVGDEICARLAEGESLRAICNDEEMPAEATVRLWAQSLDHPFSAQYVQARGVGYLKMADELVDISDDGTNDWMERFGKDGESAGWSLNGEHVQRSRLRVDTRKWLLSKCLPKIYGDRVTNEISGPNGGPIETKDTSDLELARKIAFALGRAVGRQEQKPTQKADVVSS